MQFNLKCAKNLKDEIEKFVELEKIGNNDKEVRFHNKIQVKNLTFNYNLENDKKNLNILEDINFEVKKGDCVGIQGESGSGKSTLIDLLIGLQLPSKGEILVDGMNINQSTKNWQRLVGCVPQDVFIIDDTLKKNIAFGISEKNISEDQINKCLEFSNLKDFVLSLENNLDTVIGERGARLSGGQKQRIGIARSIYHNPDILIFDESTNSLDVETEKKILSEIYSFKKQKTIFIISHKNQILKNCDYILGLKNKKIVLKNQF